MPLILDLLIRHVTLLPVITPLHRHLAGKIPRRDTIDPHTRLREFLGHHGREVDGRGFGGVVGEVALRVAHHAGHAGDDYCGAGVVMGGRLEEGQAGHGGEVDGCYVCVVGAVPVFAGFGGPEFLFQVAGGLGVGDTFGPWNAGRCHEKGEVFFFGGDLVDEFFEGVFGGDVTGNWDNFTSGGFWIGSVAFGGILQNFFAPARDVYFGSFCGMLVQETDGEKLVHLPLAART
jgi:hypothetical protein